MHIKTEKEKKDMSEAVANATVANEVLSSAQVLAEEKLQIITGQIHNAIDGINYGQYEICGLLFEASKVISETRYKSLGQYAEENFGIKKSRASQLKTVAERFLEKHETEDGQSFYACKLEENGRHWTVDALYLIASKLTDEEAEAKIASKELSSTMSVKAVTDFFNPKKQIEKKEAEEAKAEAEEAKAEAETAKAEAETAKAEAEAAKAEAEAAKDVWNTELYEINQLANFILEVCSKHASSAVVKQIQKSVEEIERLSHAE